MNAPPLLVSFTSVEKYIEALPEKHRESYATDIIALYSQGFPPVVSKSCLAILFGFSNDFIYTLATKPNKFYRSFSIRKGKKTRQIFAPKVGLKVIQKWLVSHLSNAIEFQPHVLGFVKGKSFADASKIHIGARWVLSIDIMDFFPSINKTNVIQSLLSEGYSQKSAELIADLCCLNNVLAQGSPASPVLSNLFMKEIDLKLVQLSQTYNVCLSRYADDITFSGIEDYPESLLHELKVIFNESGLSLNTKKNYFADASQGQRLMVHGLLVKQDKIALTKNYRNKLRAYKHMIENNKVAEKDIIRLTGHINFSEFIESSPN